jgi:F420-non-reducing hydrogenase iron-sulfur subunit
MKSFQPRIVGFLCNWCSYAASDAAGGKKQPYPANFRVVRVMCSGRIEPQLVLKAFAEGADGVAILGCHPGDCHYKEGNYNALRRFAALKRMLDQLGIEEGRLILEWVSAAEGDKFIEVVRTLCDKVKALGPLHVARVAQDREPRRNRL